LFEEDILVIAIIDYGAGNLGSVANAITKLGFDPLITNKPEEILGAKAVILPGVGEAGETVERLEALGMAKVVRLLIKEKRPFLSICVGLQVLLSETEEGGGHKCLGIISGTVKKLPEGLKVPHMGWNQVIPQKSHPIFEGIPTGTNFYFVHSYYADPDDKSLVAATTEYGIRFCSMVIKDNLIATQFHPEKSGRFGLKMYSNFLSMALGERT
jgi:imidazole glycerol-phosphate synthase subunit HisH